MASEQKVLGHDPVSGTAPAKNSNAAGLTGQIKRNHLKNYEADTVLRSGCLDADPVVAGPGSGRTERGWIEGSDVVPPDAIFQIG
jgi:hypothetical protein